MFVTGISYGSALRSPERLPELRDWRAAVTELPLSGQCPSLRQAARALHIPSYELIDRLPFVMDMRTPGQVEEYLSEVEALVGRDGRWEYLVAHYPILTGHTEPGAVRELNRVYLLGLSRLRKTCGIRVFVENVAVHPLLWEPECFDEAVKACDGLCLDLGHAHTAEAVLFRCSGGGSCLREFLRRFRGEIRCVHLYNACNDPSGPFPVEKHYPWRPMEGSGFMDLPTLTGELLALPGLEYVIHEPHRDTLTGCDRLEFGPFGRYERSSRVLSDQ